MQGSRVAVDPSRPHVGIVVIGRNEAARLPACFRSLAGFTGGVVYVDSGSRDRSVEIAKEHGLELLVLDPSHPFSAARARNEGLAVLKATDELLEFVQFIDGDCTLAAGWIDRAIAAMRAESLRAVVVGHLQEHDGGTSIYHRLCALEWKSPAGDLSNFGALGGLMFVRVSAIESVGGFNAKVIAGEDSELGVRMSAAGFKVTKIDVAMASHDADIYRFAQWWRRAVRAGHAIGQRAFLNGRGPARDCMRERRSALVWGLGLPVLAVALAVPTRGLSLLLFAGYAALGWRVFRYRRRQGDTAAEARLYALFNVIGKPAEALGLLKFFWARALGRFQLIEYK